MPLAVFTGTLESVSKVPGGRGLLVSFRVPAWHEKLVGRSAEKIAAYSAKKGAPAEVEVSLEWHYQKRTFDQLKMFRAILEKAAAVSGTSADDLYEQYLADRGPRVEVLISPDGEAAFREKFHRVLKREERGQWVYLKAISGASQWNLKQASEAIDYWLNELAAVGVDDETQVDLAAFWKKWRIAMDEAGLELIGRMDPITPDEYKSRTPICEACGCWVGDGGELAHIKARGMGGNEAGIKVTPADWLHLCVKCHRHVQHLKGWDALLEKSPWLRKKVIAALTGPGR